MNKFLQSGRLTFSVAGALLSLGAPLGWLLIQWTRGVSPSSVIADNPLLMAYLLIPTMAVFVAVGYALGLQWEKLCAVNARLVELATRDELTGLFNARRFWEDISREYKRSERHGEALSVLLLDLDHFKEINDTYGHLVGDRLLEAVAESMSERLRANEPLYRVGGEEFAVLLTDLDSKEALEVARRLRQAVANTEVALPPSQQAAEGPAHIAVTASVGVAGTKDAPIPRYQDLYNLADKALYAAKDAGRNRVVSFPGRADHETPEPAVEKPSSELAR